MGLYIGNPDKQQTIIELNNINKNLNKLDRIIENTDSNSCIDYIKKKKYEILFVVIITLLNILISYIISIS